MTDHRASQIVDALAALHSASVEPLGWHVYTHRRESLDPAQDELPAISIDVGEDQPADWKGLQSIGSALNVEITLLATDPLEADARELVLTMRQQSEALMLAQLMAAAGSKLGLGFVYSIRYDGAGPLLAEADGQQFVAGLVSKWIVAYQLY